MQPCHCCLQLHAQLYCAKCLSEGVTTHKTYSRNVAHQARIVAERAAALDRELRPWRDLRCAVEKQSKGCSELRARISSLQVEIDQSRTKARHHVTLPDIDPFPELQHIQRRQLEVEQRLKQARMVLTKEIVSVFGVGRRTTGDWEIAKVVLPLPETFLDYSSTSVNAAIMHTIHLVSLVTRYLSVALPFYIPTLHVGRPVIKPNLPLVGTTRFRDKNVLWMSSKSKTSRNKYKQFLTSFGLLAHSVAYLAYTQGVSDIGLSNDAINPGAILLLLYELADSPGLGSYTHEPGGGAIGRHLLFGLDVNKVVASILPDEDGSEEWDLVET